MYSKNSKMKVNKKNKHKLVSLTAAQPQEGAGKEKELQS